MNDDTVDLDASQLAAVEIEPSTRQIVVAGPGAGKTQVVSCMIEHLVEKENVDTADGLLVISFSNAAVNAADARLRARGLPPVTVQTIDSLAGELLRDLDEDEYGHLGFDGRIARASRLLTKEIWDRLEPVEHLIVDEVQDVVGVRADFLKVLLDALEDEAGFSLLGDPAQGIYDFQIRPARGVEPISTTTSQELFDSVEASPGVEVKHLTGQYRAESRDARRIPSSRPALLSGDYGDVEDLFADLTVAGSVTDVAAHLSRSQGTTAFLTQTNGQAMLVARALGEAGFSIEMRRSAQQKVLDRWIADLFADHVTSGITRAELNDVVVRRRPDLDPKDLWRGLRALTGGAGNEVSIPRVAQRLRGQRPLLPVFTDRPRAQFVVSTVHRAKGLEFDDVVLVDPGAKPSNTEDTDPVADARTKFVAMTRARRLTLRAEGPSDRFLRLADRPGTSRSRWYEGNYKKWMTHGFEFQVDDLDQSRPPGDDPEGVQAHLRDGVKVGDPLAFALDPRLSTLQVPIWQVHHEGSAVGTTSPEFGRDLAARVGTIEKKKSGWPILTGARVESIVTVAGDTQEGPVGKRGLWLAPVTAGLLHIAWKGEQGA